MTLNSRLKLQRCAISQNRFDFRQVAISITLMAITEMQNARRK
jgi:hypothetical protein